MLDCTIASAVARCFQKRAYIVTINAKQDINQDGMPTLFNTKIEAETLQIPPGAR